MMIKLLVTICPLLLVAHVPLSAETVQDSKIPTVSSSEFSDNDAVDFADLTSLIDSGWENFFLGKYDSALEFFDRIIISSSEKNPAKMIAAALWGKLFCHAYLNEEEKAYADLFQINCILNKIPETSRCGSYHFHQRSERWDQGIFAQFADPNEKVSVHECRSRVKATADLMKIIAMKIPNQSLSKLIAFCISEVEYMAYNCCDRTHWTECLNPIVDAWLYMKDCMDKGVAIAPKVIHPGR